VPATLAHEMAHLWQHHFAIKHGLGREDEVDRPATASTGKEDGAETGDAMGHMIVPDGPFDRAVGRLLARGLGSSNSRNILRRMTMPVRMKTAKARAASASAMSVRTVT
jgi:hypothetical protein